MSVTVILIILSGVFDFNTLFLLAAASFCVGIAFRESGIRVAFGFYIASILLGFLLAPNKFYCITFAAMSLYLLISEFFYDRLGHIKNKVNRRRILWVVKYVAFNLMFIPSVLLLPKLFYSGEINQSFLLIFLLLGQVALLIYDMAYTYFQGYVWEKMRRNLRL